MTGSVATREPKNRRTWTQPLETLQHELGELTSRFFGEGSERMYGPMPTALDLSETDHAVEARVDLPGAKAEEIEIRLSDNVLTISGHRTEEKEDEGKTYHRVERRQGSFSRTVVLPCCVDDSKIDAQFKNGVLTIKMPKTEEAKARKIKIRS